MPIRILATFLIWLFTYVIGILAGSVVVPIALKRGWDGKTSWFGNRQYGRGGNKGFQTNGALWREVVFLNWINPISNFGKEVLAIKRVGAVKVRGKTSITDGRGKIPGWYYVRLVGTWRGWEIRCVYPTFPGKCFEARIGWKLLGNSGDSATFVFRANPFKRFG